MEVRSVRTFLLLVATVLFFLFMVSSGYASEYSLEKQEMLDHQIIARNIKDKPTLAAMNKVARHLFVPKHIASHAYLDRPLPIGYGQTISQPYIVAYMTEKLHLRPDFKVLEIGTGSGYQAAVLAKIVDHVVTIEIIPELAEQAKTRLTALGYKNVTAIHGDGYFGWQQAAPYDRIIVTAAAEFVPPPLIEQLKEGGSMIIPVGSPFGAQWLMLITKRDGQAKTQRLLPVRFVPFTRK